MSGTRQHGVAGRSQWSILWRVLVSYILDHEGAVLVPVHVLPYRVCSNEYGDYAYTKTHDSGELTAATLPELAEKVRALAVEHVLGWTVPVDESGSVWDTESYKIPRLDRFKFGRDGNGCYTDFAGKIAVAPLLGATYLSLGGYRIELRLEHGSVPALPEEEFGFETVIPAMEAALQTVREVTATNLYTTKEAARAATKARKRAELARLKAELGEL